jgi:hypothetical protein
MKAIAEYFRDLSAEDRYFGAEPPVPDANMLAHIAQNEIKQRVDAKVDGNEVVLTRAPAALDESADMDRMEQDAPVQQTVADHPVIRTEADFSADFDDTSVADKLKRIRAVVARKEAEAHPVYNEDEHAVDFLPDRDDTSDDGPPDDDGPSLQDRRTDEPDTGPDADADADSAPDTDDDSGDAIRNLLNTEEHGEHPDDAPVAETPAPETETDAPVAPQQEEVAKAGPEETAPDASTEPEAEPEPEAAAPKQVAPEPIAKIDPAPPIAPVRPRIVKMKKDDYEKAVRDGTVAEAVKQFGEPLQPSPIPAAETAIEEKSGDEIRSQLQDSISSSTLSPEEEAELLNELVDVEREVEAARISEDAGKALLGDAGGQDEAAVTRLLDETNSQLENTEGVRRRSAISHLKAAVAATLADRKLNPKRKEDEPDAAEPYRSDLADVVRPNRPVATGKAQTPRVAPLVLVSEQRIDDDAAPHPAPSGVIRPRRIGHEPAPVAAPAQHSADTGFSDFVEKTGANGMTDLLEAAAAFSTFVDGRPHFGRPVMMNLVATHIGKDGFNREEGLRAFGQLLRHDKIVKVKRGQFAIAETTRFKPMERAVG